MLDQFEQRTSFRHSKLPGEMTGFLNIYIFRIYFDTGLSCDCLNAGLTQTVNQKGWRIMSCVTTLLMKSSGSVNCSETE
jgi:hypothetical protein